jgi:hypothetical protein
LSLLATLQRAWLVLCADTELPVLISPNPLPSPAKHRSKASEKPLG